LTDTRYSYIAFTEEEHAEARKERRPGRPSSAKEDLLKMRLDALKKEHEQGFGKFITVRPMMRIMDTNEPTALPDVLTKDGVAALLLWEGNWSYLSSLPWIRVTAAGEHRPSEFPTKGII
jgi:translation machinery-associated protein 16